MICPLNASSQRATSTASSQDFPDVSIAIVNFNSGPLLAQCLQAVAAQTHRAYEVVIVDNASRDQSMLLARDAVREDPRFTFRAIDTNLGFAAGNNLAAREARGIWLVTLNPDAFPEPDWLENLLSATRRHPEVEMFGSTQIDAEDPLRLDGCGDVYMGYGFYWRGGQGRPRSELPPEGRTFSACGAAAMYKARKFLELGGFDEKFFCIGEDVDLGFRWRLAGGHAIQVRDAVVLHVGSAMMGRRSTFSRYHASRNMVWTFVKNMPPALFWPLLPIHVGLVIMRIAAALVRGDAVPVIRGIRDACCRLPEVWNARQRIQTARIATTCAIARAMCWSPYRTMRRLPHIW